MSPIEQQHVISRELHEYAGTVAAGMADVVLPVDVRKLIDCFHEHLFERSLNVNRALECCDIRSPSIYRRFAAYVGVTPRRYLEDQRIMAAMRLLTFTGLTVGAISFAVGYSDYETFARAFKRYVRCSPSGYRRRMAYRRDAIGQSHDHHGSA